MNWWKNLKGKVRLKESLKDHTTFRIGGPAKYFVEPKGIDDLRLLLNLVNPVRSPHRRCGSRLRRLTSNGVKRYKIPTLVIGAGSNILINDKGIDGVVLRLNSPSFKKFSLKNNRLEVGAGCLLSKVVLLTKEHSLSGIEFLTGIPGTTGGALVMNAGVSDKNISDVVENVKVMDYNGNIKTLNKKDIKFGYRTSNLSKYIILSARIKLIKKNKEEIQNRIKRYSDYRRATQDLSWPSAGCIFKNPTQDAAGRLIDLCGLKGKKIGDAFISRRHANFILNQGKAKAGDILKLMDLVRIEVKKKFNITLEPEIKIWK